MSQKQYKVGLAGLAFGAEFAPIYQAHPLGELHAICRRDEAGLKEFGENHNVSKRYTDYNEMIQNPDLDFIHINTPIDQHASMTIAALKAGKNIMCTVPMATNVADCEEIVKLVKETGLKYLMAETVVYSREFMLVKEMLDSGELGKLQYMQASHPQDMTGWPDYWEKMIPMHYATHVVSPLLSLAGKPAEYVSCIGSGTVNDHIAKRSGSSFAVEACHIKIKDSDLGAHIWRCLYDTARQYR